MTYSLRQPQIALFFWSAQTLLVWGRTALGSWPQLWEILYSFRTAIKQMKVKIKNFIKLTGVVIFFENNVILRCL